MQTTINKINNKVLLYSTGNYIQYHIITYSGKEYEKIYIYTFIFLNHCAVHQKRNIVNQLYFKKKFLYVYKEKQLNIKRTIIKRRLLIPGRRPKRDTPAISVSKNPTSDCIKDRTHRSVMLVLSLTMFSL